VVVTRWLRRLTKRCTCKLEASMIGHLIIWPDACEVHEAELCESIELFLRRR